MQTFNKTYFGIATLIFTIEILIALFVRDNFVRPYVGDVLVVILIYCFVKSFFNFPVVPLAIGVLGLAFVIELFQYLNIVERLGLEKSPVARTVIGTSFAWMDLLAYIAGIAIVVVMEKMLRKPAVSEASPSKET
jgi:hypothetical protein